MKKKDVRRTPYNIWILFLSIVIFCSIGAIGVGLIHTAETQGKLVEIVNYEGFTNKLTTVCKEGTNCSTENTTIKLSLRDQLVWVDDDTVEWVSYGYYDTVYTDLSEGRHMIDVEPTKSWKVATTKITTLTVGIMIIVIGMILMSTFGNHYWWSKK